MLSPFSGPPPAQASALARGVLSAREHMSVEDPSPPHPWLADLRSDDLGLSAQAVEAYAESCAHVRAELDAQAEPSPELLGRWFGLMSLGSLGLGEVMQRGAAAGASGDLGARDRLSALEQQLLTSSARLLNQRSS